MKDREIIVRYIGMLGHSEIERMVLNLFKNINVHRSLMYLELGSVQNVEKGMRGNCRCFDLDLCIFTGHR